MHKLGGYDEGIPNKGKDQEKFLHPIDFSQFFDFQKLQISLDFPSILCENQNCNTLLIIK